MPGILADNDVGGQVARLVQLLSEEPYQELWTGLNLSVATFETLGLSRETPDADLWQACQSRGLMLITGNRNDDGPDSLEATIRDHTRPTSLPVFTISDPRRVLKDHAYALRAAIKLLEYLFDVDSYLGTGRLYLP